MLPIIFAENDYSVTLFGVPYAGFNEVGDMSFFETYDGIKPGHLNVEEIDSYDFIKNEKMDDRKLHIRFMYGIFKVAPTILKNTIYNDGRYLNSMPMSYSYGGALAEYLALDSLPTSTEIVDEGNNYIFYANQITHSPVMLQMPGYTFEENVDNSKYIEEWKIVLNEVGNIKMDKSVQEEHYMVNAAAYIELGKFFDYLRENDVWNNTRIIITSDHGYGLKCFDDMILEDGLDILRFNSILLVKDFESESSFTNYQLMTTADVPMIATDNLIKSPKNPFTGVSLPEMKDTNAYKVTTSDHSYSFNSEDYSFDYSDGEWYNVRESIFEADNWKKENSN